MTAPRNWGRLISNIPLPEQNLVGIAAGLVLQRVLPLRFGRPSGLPSMVRRAASGASLAAGSGVITWAWLAARSTRLARPDALITSGPYAFSRNPMYVGWALVHLGVGLLRNDAWIVAALPLASAAVHRGVRREEALLETAFPEDFTRYRESVPRYVPTPRAEFRAARPLRPRRRCAPQS
jgi:protein-S-isoprenylcysteine O-methyltransferase Ste14